MSNIHSSEIQDDVIGDVLDYILSVAYPLGDAGLHEDLILAQLRYLHDVADELAFDRGYSEGYSKGHKIGYDVGYDQGVDDEYYDNLPNEDEHAELPCGKYNGGDGESC